MGSLLKKQEIPKNLPQSHSPNAAACGYLPEQEATSLGTEEYNAVVLSVGNIVNPDKNSSSNRKRGNYNHYSPKMRAKTGKYASENGNLRAINHFKAQLPNLTESTVGTFKQAHQKTLKERKSQGGIQESVTAIPHGTRGRPPIVLDLDQKLISLLKSIRNRGGVVNFSVVKVSALASIKSNPAKDFRGFEPTSTWVRAIYRRYNFSRRAGTTTRPPVPLGIYEECKLTFLTDIERCIA